MEVNSTVYTKRVRSSSVDRDIKEQSYYIYKMSVSCCGFKAEVVSGCEVIQLLTEVTSDEESSSDDDVKSVEACRHKECGSVNSVRNSK